MDARILDRRDVRGAVHEQQRLEPWHLAPEDGAVPAADRVRVGAEEVADDGRRDLS